jgi:hypothetical protein
MQTLQEISNILKEFMDNETRSCSMDFGCITPLYVYRMWGGTVAIDVIENALNYLKANNYGY